MSQIAFVTWNGGGNLGPALAIARASPARPPRRLPGPGDAAASYRGSRPYLHRLHPDPQRGQHGAGRAPAGDPGRHAHHADQDHGQRHPPRPDARAGLPQLVRRVDLRLRRMDIPSTLRLVE